MRKRNWTSLGIALTVAVLLAVLALVEGLTQAFAKDPAEPGSRPINKLKPASAAATGAAFAPALRRTAITSGSGLYCAA